MTCYSKLSLLVIIAKSLKRIDYTKLCRLLLQLVVCLFFTLQTIYLQNYLFPWLTASRTLYLDKLVILFIILLNFPLLWPASYKLSTWLDFPIFCSLFLHFKQNQNHLLVNTSSMIRIITQKMLKCTIHSVWNACPLLSYLASLDTFYSKCWWATKRSSDCEFPMTR